MLREDDYLGANVTIPHKEAVLDLLDECDPWAAELGAVNTIVKSGARLIGHNTDAYGFLRSLKDAGFEPRGKAALLLGAGGAARSAAFGLAKGGITSLRIANRTPERARLLAAELAGSLSIVSSMPLEEDALKGVLPHVDLVVNATPVGMSPGPSGRGSPIDSALVSSDTLVYDMVYSPLDTPLMREARKAGARAQGGLAMLVYQGAASFELWTGREAPLDVMFRAAAGALADDHSADGAFN
jgi:shikimate dehydrogenase